MNVRSLRYFLKVAEYGSITRAASELFLTQPALTRHIAILEEEFQCKLLLRYGRGVSLTESGRLVADRAAAIIAQIEDLSDELAARETHPQGELSVGLPYTWSQLATEMLVRFRDQHPAVRIRIIIESSETLKGFLKSHYIDLAVITTQEDDSEVEAQVLANDNQFLVGNKDSDIESLDHVSITELARRPMIRTHNATVGLKNLSRKLAQHGLTVNTIIETSASMQLNLVEAGLGYASVPGCALTLHGHDIKAAPIEGMSIIWTLAWLRSRPRTAALNAFEAILRDVMKSKVASGEWPSVTLVDG